MERAIEPDGGPKRVGRFGNLFLEQGMREGVPEDPDRGRIETGGRLTGCGDVDGGREPLVVVERDAEVMPRPRREQAIRRCLTWLAFAQLDPAASLRQLRVRMFRGVERTPAGVRLGLLLVVGLVAATISQIEYSGTQAARDRAVRQAAAASRVAGELRRDNAILANERDTARRDADEATHALEDTTTDLRRWRRIAADREQRANRARRHR